MEIVFILPQQKGFKKEHEYNKEFSKEVERACEIISDRVRRSQANFIISSPEVARVLDNLNNSKD